MLRRWVLPAAAGCALAAAGCGMTGRASAVDVDARAWSEAAVLAAEADDTVARYDIEFFVRCNARFEEDTLTLRITTLTPDSLRCEEPLRLTIPPRSRAAALRREARATYRLRSRMASAGTWRWLVVPSREVRGVEAVGVRIEKSK